MLGQLMCLAHFIGRFYRLAGVRVSLRAAALHPGPLTAELNYSMINTSGRGYVASRSQKVAAVAAEILFVASEPYISSSVVLVIKLM